MDYIFYVSFLYVCYRKNGFFSVFGKFLDSTALYKNCMNRGWNIKKKKENVTAHTSAANLLICNSLMYNGKRMVGSKRRMRPVIELPFYVTT